jgi:Uma2 family endonuclease
VAIITKTTGLTYADLQDFPDDGNRYEIIDGVLYVSPSPSEIHQRGSMGLTAQVGPHVLFKRLGRVYTAPFDVKFADGTVVQPDLVFVANDRLDILTAGNITGAPTLVVEILSPSTRTADLRVKRDAYARHGVPYYWLVDPALQTVEAYELRGGEYVRVAAGAGRTAFSAPPFPNLQIDLSLLWD